MAGVRVNPRVETGGAGVFQLQTKCNEIHKTLRFANVTTHGAPPRLAWSTKEQVCVRRALLRKEEETAGRSSLQRHARGHGHPVGGDAFAHDPARLLWLRTSPNTARCIGLCRLAFSALRMPRGVAASSRRAGKPLAKTPETPPRVPQRNLAVDGARMARAADT